jgi:hypothetical protein
MPEEGANGSSKLPIIGTLTQDFGTDQVSVVRIVQVFPTINESLDGFESLGSSFQQFDAIEPKSLPCSFPLASPGM